MHKALWVSQQCRGILGKLRSLGERCQRLKRVLERRREGFETGGARRARISPAVEEIIAATLRELWLRPEQPDLAPIVDEIRTRCDSEGLDPPAYVTVSKRILRLFTPEEIARRRHSGGKSLRRLKPRPGYIRAKHALDVVQIDHTPADIQFVEVIDDAGNLVKLLFSGNVERSLPFLVLLLVANSH